MSERWAMGVDVGSVTVKFVLVAPDGQARYHSCRRTDGAPLDALVSELRLVAQAIDGRAEVSAVGTTGSGRQLAAAVLGADLVKNEITAHAVGTLHWRDDIRTIIEIGGQDSKIIHLRDGMVVDFAMNTICAAGTGAFLDQQATRLQIPIEQFGPFAMTGSVPVRIAGRCSVFAESDMMHKQQAGHDKADICLGLCQALVRNYLNNVARGVRIHSPVAFQGGVSHNEAIMQCFRQSLPECEIVRPPLTNVRGAFGAALLAQEAVGRGPTRFGGWQQGTFAVRAGVCPGCVNECELLSLHQDDKKVTTWGGRCERALQHV